MENRILYEDDLSSSASSTNLYDPAEPLHTHPLPEVVTSSGTRGSLKTRVHDVKERVMPFVDEKLHSAKVKANDAIQTAKLRTSDTIQTAKIKSTDAKIKARSFMRANPAVVAGISTGLGLAAGMFLRSLMRRNRHLGVLVVETRPGAAAAW
jgi:ElaB/YqjD/DUF883 family membrane-anchored ribosome-binding protein